MTDTPPDDLPARPAAPRAEPVPILSLALGYGPMLVLLALAIASWVLRPLFAGIATAMAGLWAGALLFFLAGVTRGLSFFTPGGPHRGQVWQALWLYVLAFAALLMQAQALWIAFVILIMGYTSIAIFDPAAAKRGWAPSHFTRLRIPQMAITVVALLILLARVKLVA